jgi:hypothetical protein
MVRRLAPNNARCLRLPRQHTTAQTTPPRPPALLPRRRPNLPSRRRRPRSITMAVTSSCGCSLGKSGQRNHARKYWARHRRPLRRLRPKRVLLQERIRGVLKATHGGRKKGGTSGCCGPCHPMSGEHASSARVVSVHYLLYTRVHYRHEGPEGPSTWECDAPDGQLGSSLAAPTSARHRGPDI